MSAVPQGAASKRLCVAFRRGIAAVTRAGRGDKLFSRWNSRVIAISHDEHDLPGAVYVTSTIAGLVTLPEASTMIGISTFMNMSLSRSRWKG